MDVIRPVQPPSDRPGRPRSPRGPRGLSRLQRRTEGAPSAWSPPMRPSAQAACMRTSDSALLSVVSSAGTARVSPMLPRATQAFLWSPTRFALLDGSVPETLPEPVVVQLQEGDQLRRGEVVPCRRPARGWPSPPGSPDRRPGRCRSRRPSLRPGDAAPGGSARAARWSGTRCSAWRL